MYSSMGPPTPPLPTVLAPTPPFSTVPLPSVAVPPPSSASLPTSKAAPQTTESAKAPATTAPRSTSSSTDTEEPSDADSAEESSDSVAQGGRATSARMKWVAIGVPVGVAALVVAAIVIQALRWQRRRNARTRQDYAQTLGGAGEYPGPPPRHPNMIVLGGANGVCELGDDISELAVPSYGRIPTSDSSRPTTGGKGGELPPKYHELPENTVQRDSKDK